MIFIFIFEVELIYNVTLVSGVQHSDSVIHIYIYTFFFRFFSLIGYYKIFSIVPCATFNCLLMALSFSLYFSGGSMQLSNNQPARLSL